MWRGRSSILRLSNESGRYVFYLLGALNLLFSDVICILVGFALFNLYALCFAFYFCGLFISYRCRHQESTFTTRNNLIYPYQQIDCPRATERLRINLPSTVSDPSQLLPASTGPGIGSGPGGSSSTPQYHQYQHHHQPSSTPQTSSTGGGGPTTAPGPIPSNSQVLLATEAFITFLDALKLGYASKDTLHPLLADIIQTVNAVTERDFEGRGKIIAWLIRLNGMKAQEELEREVEIREMEFDIAGAYRGFKAVLN